MKLKNKKAQSYNFIEKPIIIFGAVILCIGIIANIFSLFHSLGYITDTLSFLYYIRYIIMIISGIIMGIAFAAKKNKLFSCIIYTLLTTSLYFTLDIFRAFCNRTFGYFAFPWGKILFEGAPLFAVAITILFIIFAKNKQAIHEKYTKILLVACFAVYQFYLIFDTVYALASGIATFDAATTTIWLIIVSIVCNPIIIAIISYISLGPINNRFNRLFFATIIATLGYLFVLLIWEFRTDASAEATNLFSLIVNIVEIIFVSGLLYNVRTIMRRDKSIAKQLS